jgi:hypothetical protein
MVPWEVVFWTLAELGLFAHFEHLPALSNTFSFNKTYHKHQGPLQPSTPYHPHTLFTQVIVLSSLSTHSPTAPLISTTKLLQTTISASNCNVWYGITQSPCSEIWTHTSPFSVMLYILVPLLLQLWALRTCLCFYKRRSEFVALFQYQAVFINKITNKRSVGT